MPWATAQWAQDLHFRGARAIVEGKGYGEPVAGAALRGPTTGIAERTRQPLCTPRAVWTTVSETRRFGPGDEVVHPVRPEWGPGIVERATRITHEGQSAQRLTVRFRGHGRVTINTGVVALVGKDATKDMSSATTSRSRAADFLGRPTAERQLLELSRLPDDTTDPFASLARRLAATVQTFRFGQDPRKNPRGLIEWAVAQTGMEDPLTRFTRHELEEAFSYFVRCRDQHLRKLVAELKREGQHSVVLEALHAARYPTAKALLQRALRE